MTRIGVLTNPGSTRNRRRPGGVATLARAEGLVHVELGAFEQAEETLAALADAKVDLVAVNGGDGTVCSALSALQSERLGGWRPPLAVLSGGMGNAIALDVGLAGQPDEALGRLVEAVRSGPALERLPRRLLALQRARDPAPRYGMFMGLGAFSDSIRLLRARVQRVGGRFDGAALGIGLLLGVLRALCGRGDGSGAFDGVDLRLDADGAVLANGRSFLALVSTLDRFMLGIHPFWGDGAGPIKVTTIDHPPRSLWRALWPALRARPRPWMAEAGYRSAAAERLTLIGGGTIVLDGETIETEPDERTLVDAERRMLFVRPAARG